jgi:hypothetical protein
MTSRRGLHWLALATLLGPACDKTLSFEPNGSPTDGGESGTSGTAGVGGSLLGEAGTGEPWHRGGSTGVDPGPAGNGGLAGVDQCMSFCWNLGQHCDQVELKCVECFKNEDCGSDLYCNRGLNRCVECNQELGCPDNKTCDYGMCRERCATAENPERDCRDDSQICDERDAICVACYEDDDCEGSPERPYCLPGGARCAECVADNDCGGGKPRCDPVLFECVECRDSRDCELPFVCHTDSHTCYDSRIGVPFPT